MRPEHRDHPLVRLFTEADELVGQLINRAGEFLGPVTRWLLLAGVVLLLIVGLLMAARLLRSRRLAVDGRRIRILAPPDVAAAGASTLWMGLHAILRPLWRRVLLGQPHLAWEVVAEPDSIEFSLWVPRIIPPGLVERAVESAWPGARTETEDVEAPFSAFVEGGATAVTELGLAEPE